MSPLTLRQVLQRARGHGSTVLAVAALAVAVAGHHSGIALGDQHHGDGLPVSLELCLGAFITMGAAAVVVALTGLLRRHLRPCLALRYVRSVASVPPEPRARAGPSVLATLCVRRC